MDDTLARGLVPDILLQRDANADSPRDVAPEVFYLLDRIVNVCFMRCGRRAGSRLDADRCGAAGFGGQDQARRGEAVRRRSANLAAADGGFDVTVPAASSTIDLR